MYRPEYVKQRRERLHALTAANDGVAPTAVHNVSTYRDWGCRCQTCKDAASTYAAWTRQQAQARTRAGNGPDIVHGASSYRYHGCRCDECVEGHRVESLRSRHRCAAKRAAAAAALKGQQPA